MKRARRPSSVRAATYGAAALLGACSTGGWLPDENRQEPYASLARAAAAAPHQHARYAVTAPGGAPVEVALDVVRSPRGAGRPVLVLQPGILSDGSTWRFLVGALDGAVDSIAVDPPGTGASGAPDPRRAGPGAYGPSWLAEHTLLALEAWEHGQSAAPRYVLVGHSLGATAVLRMLTDSALADRHAALLARVEGLVLFAPADIALERPNAEAQEFLRVTDLEVALGSWIGVLRSRVAKGVREGATDPRRDALQQEAERIASMMGREDQRHAAQAMIANFRPLEAQAARGSAGGAASLGTPEPVPLPVRLLWGRDDGTVPLAQSTAMLQRLPGARLEVVEGSKHSLHQERATQAAAQILDFLEHDLVPHDGTR